VLVLSPQRAAAAPGDYIESFGPDGTTGTEFGRPAALAVDQESGAVYVGDSESQTLYKFDSGGAPLDYEAIASNEISGLLLNEGNVGQVQVAVDPETHVIYVISAGKLRAFEANGEPHEFTSGGGSELDVGTEPIGVAVDDSGKIYVSDGGPIKKVRIYARSGVPITEFAPVSVSLSPIDPGGLAVAPDGTLYVTALNERVYAFEPTRFPVSDKTTYGLGQPLQKFSAPLAVAVAVDPSTEYVYVSELCPSACVSRIAVYDEEGNFVGAIGAEGPGELEGSLPAGLGVNAAGHKVYGAVRGEGATLSQVAVYETFPIPIGPPILLGSAVTNVTSTSAVLRARINPNALETTYQFEYGLEDCSAVSEPCSKVPSLPVSIGSGHKGVAVSAVLSGLIPGTRYFFRVVAQNGEGVEKSATRSFTTQAGQLGASLSDSRVWEQVTPANKFGGAVTNARLLQADPNGTGIAFQTRGSIVEDPEGNRALETSAALARRGASGWSVEDLVPRHSEAGGLGFGPEFKLFSSNLQQALLEPRDDTPLSPESSERAPNLRTNTSPPSYRPLVTSKEGFANVPEGTVFGGEANGARNPVSVSGANSSLTDVVISANAALVEGAEERSLYHWSDGAIERVSQLPLDEGGGGPVTAVKATLGSGPLSVRHAVSEDGSRVFWAPGDPLGTTVDWPALYMRDTVADETVRIDLPEEGANKEGAEHPAFMAANADGSVVYFTDSQHLTEDASPEGRDLYRCEIGDVEGSLGCVDIEDLSAPLLGSGENGDAKELAVGISEDGSTIYFVAEGVLDLSPNGAGETAVPGSPNLYLWQEGVGVRFIAPLSGLDGPDWGVLPALAEVAHAARGTATSSPDGRYLVFMSQQGLGGVETADPETGEPVEQAFRYDSAEDELICISCNPSGATDSGRVIVKNTTEGGVIFPDPQQLWGGRRVGATLPETSEGESTIGLSLYWPRAVLDNGRAYFNSVSPLVTGDSNETWDAYQYEPFAVGSCAPSAGSRMVATTETGCVALVSSGLDPQPSAFMDASATGDDVFFATFGRLSALDTDDNADVYDARVGGVEATVERPTECAGETCQQRGLPPADSAPSSSTFNGAGNVKAKPAKHCHHGQKKVRKKGKVKCVPRKKGGGSGKQGGAR
jgi:DNA-binding beta-propeller fold protein YncE